MTWVQAQIKGKLEGKEHSGLCALDSALMDELDANPGDYVCLCTNPWCTDGKQVLARLWPAACDPGMKLSPEETQGRRMIQCDPQILQGLEAAPGNTIYISARPRIFETSAVTLEPSEKLSKEQREALSDIIPRKGWPVRNGAVYALNLNGRPLALKVVSDHSPEEILARGTRIIWAEAGSMREAAEKLTRQARLEDVQRRLAVSEKETRKLECENRKLEHTWNENQAIIKALEDQKDKLKTELQKIEQDKMEMLMERAKVKAEIQALTNELESLNQRQVPNFNLDAVREDLEQEQKKLIEEIQEIEKKLNRFER